MKRALASLSTCFLLCTAMCGLPALTFPQQGVGDSQPVDTASLGPKIDAAPTSGAPITVAPTVSPSTVIPPAVRSPVEVSLYASPTRKDHIGRIVAPVMINGHGPYRFIVDTGASISTVSPQLVESLKLVTDDSPMLMNGITGSADVPSVLIDRMEAGDLVFKSIRLPVVWAPLMAGADGILGAAGLKSERILVDFMHNRVKIVSSDRSGKPIGFERVPAARLESGLMTISAQVGWVRARAVIDTGSERTLGNLALRDALHNINRSKAQFADVYGSTSAIVPGQIETAPTMSLGRIKISNVDVVYGDFHIFEVWKMQAKPALILGMDVLGTVRALGIDFRTQDVYVEDSDLGI
jgi:hypothetical protein